MTAPQVTRKAVFARSIWTSVGSLRARRRIRIMAMAHMSAAKRARATGPACPRLPGWQARSTPVKPRPRLTQRGHGTRSPRNGMARAVTRSGEAK
jgi:hypothetical protein